MLAAGGDGLRGYSLYRSTARWEEGTVLPDGAIDVWELIATDPAASAALWRDLLSRDLISSVTADLRPADRPQERQITTRAQSSPLLTVRCMVVTRSGAPFLKPSMTRR